MRKKKNLYRIWSIVLISVFCFSSTWANGTIRVEGENFTKDANGPIAPSNNVEVRTPYVYSGTGYALINKNGGKGEAASLFQVPVTGNYKITIYCSNSGAEVYYNLWDYNGTNYNKRNNNTNRIYPPSALSTTGGVVIDSQHSSIENNALSLTTRTDYWLGIYAQGSGSAIFDYALIECVDENTTVVPFKIEGENFVPGSPSYNASNEVEKIDTPASPYSNNAYAIVTEGNGEAAVEFEVNADGDYTIKVHYSSPSGGNPWCNLYDSTGSCKLIGGGDSSNGCYADGVQLNAGTNGITEYHYSDPIALTANTIYYVGVYGNNGTIFDYAEIIPETPVTPPLISTPDDNPTPDITPVSDPKAIVIQAEGVTYGDGEGELGLGAATYTLGECGRSYVKVQNYSAEGSEYARFMKGIPRSGTYNIYVGYAAPDGDVNCRLVHTGSDLSGISPFTLAGTGDACLKETYIGQYTFSNEDHLDVSVGEGNANPIYVDYLKISEENAYVWSPELNPDEAADPTDWTNAGNWDKGRNSASSPQTTDDVIIPKGTNYPILDDAATCKSITFHPGAEIGGQNHLTHSEAIVRFELSETGRWHMLTMPVGAKLSDFRFNRNPSVWLLKFIPDEDNNADWTYITNGTHPTETLKIGEGFAISVDKKRTEDFSIDVKGTLLTGTSKPVPLTFGEENESAFALVGNPFMTSIDFNDLYLYSGNSGIIKKNYMVWTKTDNYEGFVGITANGTYGVVAIGDVATEGYIAPLQSFFVERNGSATGDLLFDLSCTNIGKGILRSAASEDYNKLDIIAENGTVPVKTFIADREGAESARKLKDGCGTIPDIYTLDENKTVAYGAQIIDTNKITIPIGIATEKGGNMSLTFSGMSDYADTEISLIDNDDVIPLSGDTYRYDFVYTPPIQDGNVIADENRFQIAFSPKGITGIGNTVQENISVYAKDNVIYAAASSGNPIKQIYVYDIQGRMMYAETNLNLSEISINNLLLDTATVYFVKVITEKEVKNVKLITKE